MQVHFFRSFLLLRGARGTTECELHKCSDWKKMEVTSLFVNLSLKKMLAMLSSDFSALLYHGHVFYHLL